MPSDRDPNHLYPLFRRKIELLLADLAAYADVHMKGYTWKIVEGFRTAEYQNELYQKGRTIPGKKVTQLDGYKRKSPHQSSLAVDLAAKHGHTVDWDLPEKHWQYLGHLARKHGLTWGGDWESFRDRPHIEWPRADIATYQRARKWQVLEGLA